MKPDVPVSIREELVGGVKSSLTSLLSVRLSVVRLSAFGCLSDDVEDRGDFPLELLRLDGGCPCILRRTTFGPAGLDDVRAARNPPGHSSNLRMSPMSPPPELELKTRTFTHGRKS